MTALLRTAKNYQSPYDATSLPAHFALSTLTPCVLVHVVSPIDGAIIGVTSWSQTLTGVPGYPGVVFRTTTGASASNVESQQGQSPVNMEVDLFLATAGISEADALAGRWAHAETTVMVANYEALDQGQYIVDRGNLGGFVQRSLMISTEVVGINNCLVQTHGKVTRAECSRTYGDALCALDLAARGEIKTGAISAVTSQTVFRVSSLIGVGADYFGNGELTFTSGDNNGYRFKIDAWDDATGEFSLRTPTPYLPVNGNTISAKRGCRKRPEDCLDRGNTINADFFQWMPLIEDLSRLPLQ